MLGLIPSLRWSQGVGNGSGEYRGFRVRSRAFHQCLPTLECLLTWALCFSLSCGPKMGTSCIPFEAASETRSNELTRHKREEKKHTYPSQSTRLPLKLCKLTRRELMLPERVRLYREQRSTSCCRLTFLSSLIFF